MNFQFWYCPQVSIQKCPSFIRQIPEWSDSGFGMSWGRVVHQVLRFLARGDDLDLELLVRNALVAEGRDPGEKFRMLELIKAIIESEFWARMQKAEKKYFEIPFSVKTDNKELLGIERRRK